MAKAAEKNTVKKETSTTKKASSTAKSSSNGAVAKTTTNAKHVASPLKHHVSPALVHAELQKHILADGFPMVLDLHKSSGSTYTDAASGKEYLDLFTCFASIPVGLNHPKMMDEEFVNYLGKVSLNKPSNSDVYTEEMATFVKTFHDIAVPSTFKYSFFVEGGALAVENALKTAFDWKVRKNFEKGYLHERGHGVIHLRQAFHGRTGYTMSLTNTEPMKTAYFPKFNNWPRVHNPAIHFPMNEQSLAQLIKEEELSIRQIHQALHDHKDDIAAIVLEPIQGEGGDNHFRPEYLKQLRAICDEHDVMLIFDEVQTGVGVTGTMWVHEQLGVTPDIMCFGKKMQVCGIIVTDRVDEVQDNVFNMSSRINSTWGGNLTDMVRVTRYLEIIKEDKLVANAKHMGTYLLNKLQEFQDEHEGIISNARGRGLFCAFDIKPELRPAFMKATYDAGLLILSCGTHSMRFRPALNITKEEINKGMELISHSLHAALKQHA